MTEEETFKLLREPTKKSCYNCKHYVSVKAPEWYKDCGMGPTYKDCDLGVRHKCWFCYKENTGKFLHWWEWDEVSGNKEKWND